MKQGRVFEELAAEIVRREGVKRDFHVPTKRMHMTDGRLAFAEFDFPVNEIAARQLATYTGIPAAYYERMWTADRSLLDTNINAWLQRGKDEVRTVRTLDNTTRAFLSGSYRAIDNYEITNAVMPILMDMPDVKIASCEITDRRLYIKAINPRVETEVAVGDPVQAGVVISNSEVGLGAVSVQPLIYRLVCTNGMIAKDAGQRRNHVGRRQKEFDADYTILSEETIRADNNAFMLKLRDTVQFAADEAKFSMLVDKMRDAKDAKLTSDNLQAVVEVTTRRFGITDKETKGVFTHFVKEGDASLYGLANAVTRFSQEVTDYDRATELEATGYEIMTMPTGMYNQLNQIGMNDTGKTKNREMALVG